MRQVNAYFEHKKCTYLVKKFKKYTTNIFTLGSRFLLILTFYILNPQQFFVNTKMTKTKPIMIDQINLKTLTIMTKYLVHTGRII